MNINELFETIQNELVPKQLNGDFTLHENNIIWSHTLNNNEGLDFFDDDDEESFSFETISSEELLQEAYQEDYNKLQEFLDNIEEANHWSFSDDEIIDNTISFNIY